MARRAVALPTRLLSALREEGLIPAALPIERTEHEQIVDVFAAYIISRMREGSPPRRWESHKLLSRRFLQEVCPAGADGFAGLTPEIVIGYVERHALDDSIDSHFATTLAKAGERFLTPAA
ncbi:hypothetical protein NKJ06_27480 [Mesorhizobium sp. M0293]|uniref:hypothetical protein n=1 Tax=Mesorhizobium sp. M0293 TaxID=2956930 RepID=UPI00333C38AB